MLGLVVVLALVGAGAAYAANRSNERDCAEVRSGPRLAVRQAFTTAADYVGLSRAEMVARLRGGESLADIAEAEGKSVEGLKGAIRAAIAARLDAAVDDLVHRARAPRG